ncbi:MAG: hypothetical protein AB7E80_05750 [Hyphomicrobiaceae bacterium]
MVVGSREFQIYAVNLRRICWSEFVQRHTGEAAAAAQSDVPTAEHWRTLAALARARNAAVGDPE